jgi:hypothetical protein
MKMNPFMAWVTANIGYHHVHHLNARIPFYRLPEVMKALPELQAAKTTSLHPVEIWRCLRLKVWDVPAQRMVCLDGIASAPARTDFTSRELDPAEEPDIAPFDDDENSKEDQEDEVSNQR